MHGPENVLTDILCVVHDTHYSRRCEVPRPFDVEICVAQQTWLGQVLLLSELGLTSKTILAVISGQLRWI